MHYSILYSAYGSKIDADRAFTSKDAAIEYDKSQAEQILLHINEAGLKRLIESPSADTALAKAILFVAQLVNEAPMTMESKA